MYVTQSLRNKHARPSSTTMEAVKSSDQARLHTGVAERTGNSSVNMVHDHRGELVGKCAGPLPNLLSAQLAHAPATLAEVEK